MWFLQLLLLIFILGIIILIHEFGHFITAKKSGVFIYEFSIGMGPVIFSHKGKDGIDYNVRAFPIGGFVSMAGEVLADEKVPKDKLLISKPWYKRLLVLVAGVMMNFILAIVLLFTIAMIWGAPSSKPLISEVVEGSAMQEAGAEMGDLIVSINGKKVKTWDKAQIILAMKNKNDYYTFVVEREDGTHELKVIPQTKKDENGNEIKVFGVGIHQEISKGFGASIKYAFHKFGTIVDTMAATIGGLFTGKLSLNALSGPVGIYQVVGQSISLGISNIIYLIAFLSINVGFINILPFPAFDGGHVLFLIIEMIKGKPVKPELENIINTIGFGLLILLMLYVTFQDILRIF